jgi:hypothetical protein
MRGKAESRLFDEKDLVLMNLMKQDQTIQIESEGLGDQALIPGDMLIPIFIVFAHIEGVVGSGLFPPFRVRNHVESILIE